MKTDKTLTPPAHSIGRPHVPCRETSGDVSPQLLSALRESNHEAFKDLYLLYYEPICKFVYSMTKSQSDSEDIVQNIFAKIWEKRTDLGAVRSMKAYLYVAARNSVIEFFRTRRPQTDLSPESLEQLREESVSSEEDFIARETELLIKLALSRMPRIRRQIFEMSRYEGLSNEDIARKLHLSSNAVASHIYNAKKDLRDIIYFCLLFLLA